MMRSLCPGLICAALLFSACSSTQAREPYATVSCWGSLREVLREGETEGRVQLERVVQKGTWGVGALEGLEGEITIIDGATSLAIVEGGELTHRELAESDEATLLVIANVEEWSEQILPEVQTLSDLEFVLEAAIRESDFHTSEGPVPLRIEGRFDYVAVHVMDHSCPIANPDGPPPWRWSGAQATGTIVGVYARGQGGVLTHHGQSVHLHAVLQTADGQYLSGHLDEVALGAGVRLSLPVPPVD
ncbi:MAG: alpha-acetolactate decarboxylase [Planctomycetota bacterium]|jgi:alpha-acetolactate decarboxylase